MLNALRIKPYLPRLFLAVLILFIGNKFILRPFVLDHDAPTFAKVVVLSIPNTFEAIIGMCNVAGLLLLVRRSLSPRFDGISEPAVYLLATAVVGTYVLTQEFKIHNLGGRNTYDPYDALASVVGVVGMLFVFLRVGILQQAEEAT